MNRIRMTCCFLFACLLQLGISFAQDLAPAANAFIESLDADAKRQACFPFDHRERFDWHFVPRQRNGLTFHHMTAQQKAAALDLMRASLGEPGVKRTEAIFELENVLRDVENRPANDRYRDPLNYYFSIFGTPGGENEWGWRLEGHHLSLNFSSRNQTIVSATPSFMGSNPALVLSGPFMNQQVLAEETDQGFALLHALDETQRKQAKFSEKAPVDIITSNDREAALLDPKGIAYGSLNENQQHLLQSLLMTYLSRYTATYRDILLERIHKLGWEDLTFAWAGSETNAVGEPHYYRIQGADLLIEYDNVQNNANHVHTVVRDLQNDFGQGDALRSHYQQEHLPNALAKQGQ
ncbi:DUF3500 domain-containing protein [Cyclobacterium xiamenense]|uniref:DUF3500 domain-containing protein n=1 Tax=Cyclobacterium xiamenense TaxID=1297121 RepID=UPI001F514E45|nr:DUF3500 domain-containing protein [Cyclobacterium xiamenense]